jgi:hypothetical protein
VNALRRNEATLVVQVRELTGANESLRHQYQQLQQQLHQQAAASGAGAYAYSLPPVPPPYVPAPVPFVSSASSVSSAYAPPPAQPIQAAPARHGPATSSGTIKSNSGSSAEGSKSLAALGHGALNRHTSDNLSTNSMSSFANQSSSHAAHVVHAHPHNTVHPTTHGTATASRPKSLGAIVGNNSSLVNSSVTGHSLGDGSGAAATPGSSITGSSRRQSMGHNSLSVGISPFATDHTSINLNQNFDQLDRQLTELMQEKTSLHEENER